MINKQLFLVWQEPKRQYRMGCYTMVMVIEAKTAAEAKRIGEAKLGKATSTERAVQAEPLTINTETYRV